MLIFGILFINSSFGNVCNFENKKLIHSTKFNVPNGTPKYVRYIVHSEHFDAANTLCIDSSTELGVGANMADYGKNVDTYFQCKNSECLTKTKIGEDRYEVYKNQTSSPCSYQVNLKKNYGEKCEPNDSSFQYFYALYTNNYMSYYAQVDLVEHRKIIKVVTNDRRNPSSTFCLGKDDYFGYVYTSKFKSNSTYPVKFYQCKNFECNDFMHLATDIITTNNSGDLDHSSYMLKVDKNYGQNCSSPAYLI